MKKPALQIHTSFTNSSAGITKRTPRSAKLSSTCLQTPRKPVEVYLELIRNAQKRNFKLDRFFGPSELRPRIDACTIREAFDHGLAGCLSSKRVISYFLLYLLEENLVQELFFLLKVEQFEHFPYTTFRSRADAASLIYDTYIHPAGLLYVENIPSTVRKITKDILTRCIAEDSASITVCFNAAKLQVWDVLEEVFCRFKNEKGPVYRLLHKHFEPESILYGPTALNPIIKRVMHQVSVIFGCMPMAETGQRQSSNRQIFPLTEQGIEPCSEFESKRARFVNKILLSFLQECLELDVDQI